MTQKLIDASTALSLNPFPDLPNDTPGKPLAIITNPSGDYAVSAGETFELRITVSNQGNQGAVINVYVDETSGLRQWCDSPYQSLALTAQHSAEVVFRFQVPPQAIPSSYSYLLVVDAPKHYPEAAPLRHQARLQVLPPVHSVVRVNDPTFTVLPATSSTKPAFIQPGQPLQLRVLVYNRSDRVDRFRLTCTDRQDCNVVYPEGISELGLAVEADSLALNPSAKGEILLLFNLPSDITAGSYLPTVRLTSDNHPDLVLMEVVYLQVLPIYNLGIELRTILGKVRRGAGIFYITVANAGNTAREIAFRARGEREEQLCTYTLKPTLVRLAPQERAKVDLLVLPTKRWRRPWFGKGLPLSFYIEIEDSYQLPLSKDSFEGTLVWEARPWWQFVLVLLLGVATAGALIFLVWWLFFRPPAVPKILEFTSEAPYYKAVDGDFIRLNWQISNPSQIQTLNFVGQSPDGTLSSKPAAYDFSQGIPQRLKEFCIVQQVLICRNVRTDARQAGDYIFALTVVPKRGAASQSLKTNTIKIQPIESPKIIDLTPTQPVYQEASNTKLVTNNTIRLNWKITHPDQLQELRLIGRAPDGTVNSQLKVYSFNQGISPLLKEFCTIQAELICQNVPTDARQAGNYIFELSVTPKRGDGEQTASKKTDTIKIEPKQVPLRIVTFQINGQEAPPRYLLAVNRKTPPKPLTMFWKVEGGKDIKVDLLPTPGTVPPEGNIAYPVSQQSGVATITLQVTNSSGKKIERSVTIETFAPTLSQSPNASPAFGTTQLPFPANIQLLPTPTAPESFAPALSQPPKPPTQNTKASPAPAKATPPGSINLSPPVAPGTSVPMGAGTPSPAPPSPIELPPKFN